MYINCISSNAYKTVDKKIRPVAAPLPEDCLVKRRFPEDPLDSLPSLSPIPLDFIPTSRLTADRLKILKINQSGFLWPEEEKLFISVFMKNEEVLAFDETERGTMRQDYFTDYIIPTIEHVPWAKKPIPVPPGIRPIVIEALKKKLDIGVYESSQASYRASMFFIKKTDGGIRQIIDLQPLNAITIRDAGMPPNVDYMLEPFTGASVYSSFDLLSGYDARKIHPKSRDLTSFQTPLGLLRSTVLPQGFTNSVAEFQNCTTFILQDEIPNKAGVMIDDVGIQGPHSRYEQPDGSFEVIPENPKIRRFIWEHAQDVNRILHRLKHAGATISPKKSKIAVPDIVLIGQRLSYTGRLPDSSRISKIQKWPVPINVTQIRQFLGLCGTMRIWIQGYSAKARPLTELVRKDIPFEWDDRRQAAFETLKQEIIDSPALIPIDYSSPLPVILAVDTSVIAIGFIIYQMDKDKKRRPVRFGSIPLNPVEAKYSQAKLELYGLYRALRACHYYLIGVKNLIVEVDASYIKQMINNPDLAPTATINRWIEGILLYHFMLRHVPADSHKGPDGLSRRPPAPDDTDEEDYDAEEEATGLREEFLNLLEEEEIQRLDENSYPHFLSINHITTSSLSSGWTRPTKAKTNSEKDETLKQIFHFLSTMRLPQFPSDKEKKSFIQKSQSYFIQDKNLWKRNQKQALRVILDSEKRKQILKMAHDDLGHRGSLATYRTLCLRYYWPTLREDTNEYIRTCHECQIRSTKQMHIPLTISHPTTLFSKVYLDIMLMPPAQGYKYIVAARDDLSGAAEGRKLKKISAQGVARFIFEELICRYGNIQEIVTDNGPETKAATEELLKTYNIKHIRISPYNSQANGVVERGHFTIREALLKTISHNVTKWPDYVHHVFFADRVTVRQATGFSPYYLIYGTHPTLPLDLYEATFLVEGFRKDITTEELITLRTRQLAKMKSDVLEAEKRLHQSRLRSKEVFEEKFSKRIRREDFNPGELVLVRNSRIEKELNRKAKPRYIGPYEVVRRTIGGSYVLKELDGTISRVTIAGFRLIPYYPRLGEEILAERLSEEDAIDEDIPNDMAAEEDDEMNDWGQS